MYFWSLGPMAAGTGAVVAAGGKQLITLGTRLVVGIHLNDTIVHFPNSGNGVMQFRMRPFLKYFATVLQRFKVDVMLFTNFSVNDHWMTLARLRRELEPLEPIFYGVPLSTMAIMRSDMVAVQLQKRAVACMTPPSRILFIDSEADVKFPITQTLVLERFAPARRLRNSERDPTVAPEHKKLALTMNDYTLVALAEIIKDMAASNVPQDVHARPSGVPEIVVGKDGKTRKRRPPLGIAVEDYLRLEPLVEKVSVPMHGLTNYLPIENCDHMDEMDISKLEISEPLPHEEDNIKETEEHKQMFQ
jgi:hypothetical protein